MAYIQIGPIMTSNTSPYPYVVERNGCYGAREAWKLFTRTGDLSVSRDYWDASGNGAGSWVSIDLVHPEIVTKYTITTTSSTSDNFLSDSPRDWKFEGSNDKANWDTLDTQTGFTSWASSQTREFIITNNKRYRYYRISNAVSRTGRGVGFSELGLYKEESTPPIYGIYNNYYVSQQNGNDDNDGLSPDTAWATLTKAVNTVKPVRGDTVTVYISPGTYREVLAMDNYAEEQIIFSGDPDCVHFNNCTPGVVRISGYESDEQTPIDFQSMGAPIMFFGNICVKNIEICSPKDGAIASSLESCKIWAIHDGIVAFSSVKNCEVYAGNIGYLGVPADSSAAYNCVCFARIGFNSTNCYHCFSIGHQAAFNFCTSYNCAAQYSPTGFSGGSCYNCIASNCKNGFTSTAGSNRKSIGCSANTGDSPGSAFYFLPEIKTIIKNGIVDKGIPIVDNPTDLLGLERAGGDGNIDIGPIESCDYSLEYNDYYLSAPAVRINRKGQLSFKFRINAGDRVIKQVTVKHANTASSLKPQVVIRGLGIELTKTVEFESDLWETLTFSFVAPADGVMEVILYARDSNEDSYSLFANFI